MRLLIIGDHAREVAEASRIAAGRGALVRHHRSLDAALDDLRGGKGADLLLLDVALDTQGVIRTLLAERIHLPVVVYGVDTEPAAAAAAIRAGAREFLPLPPDPETIAAILESVAEETGEIVSADPAMQDLLRLAAQFAPADASVLVTGESGTGKEMIARYLHRHSRRASGPFVSLNCAAIPENLLESELFGHEKGAFTGAVARRVGKFEEAHGGTLLLDEVTEMDPRLQAKLLRAIQEREIDRVGGNRPVRIDIRLVATSNRDLETAVADGIFREDLLFRLNVLNLHIPPLRQRPRDIPVLARHFVSRHAAANGLPDRPLAEATVRLLLQHGWKGNVRELDNCMHRAVLMATGREVGPEAILLQGGSRPAEPQGREAHAARPAIGRTVAEVERDLILDTLRHTLGNRTHAATVLGISIRTLRNKLRQYGEEGLTVPSPALGSLR